MSRLQTWDNGNHYTLLNINGRLAPCICCCIIDRLLYLHIDPVKDEVECSGDQGTAEGTDEGGYIFTGDGTQDEVCKNFETSAASDLSGLMQCWDGGTGRDFGMAAVLYCLPVDRFVLNLCFEFNGHPTSIQTCSNPTQPLEPVAENTCEAKDKEFFIDFGNLVPMSTAVGGGCVCEYHIYIDEISDGSLAVANNLFWYPWESGTGLRNPGLSGMLGFLEFMPGLGTPLHLRKPPTTKQLRRDTDPLPEFIADGLKEW